VREAKLDTCPVSGLLGHVAPFCRAIDAIGDFSGNSIQDVLASRSRATVSGPGRSNAVSEL
jgi:hypothetical protein